MASTLIHLAHFFNSNHLDLRCIFGILRIPIIALRSICQFSDLSFDPLFDGQFALFFKLMIAFRRGFVLSSRNHLFEQAQRVDLELLDLAGSRIISILLQLPHVNELFGVNLFAVGDALFIMASNEVTVFA